MWLTGKVIERVDWNDKLFSLKILAPIAPFKAGQFIKLALEQGGRRVSRAYSLVNAPDTPYLEVLAIAVDDGDLSPNLHNLAIGDSVLVSEKASGFMTLDEIPQTDNQQLWMLATGSALGPFLSMLTTAEPWQRFDKIILVYGVRYSSDLAYLSILRMLAQRHPQQFTVLTSVTREKGTGDLDERIPQALTDGKLERLAHVSINDRQSQVMVCGNPEMISATVELLLQRGLKKNLRREPGRITVERYW